MSKLKLTISAEENQNEHELFLHFRMSSGVNFLSDTTFANFLNLIIVTDQKQKKHLSVPVLLFYVTPLKGN